MRQSGSGGEDVVSLIFEEFIEEEREAGLV
jgi:hypothetical protein